MSAAFTRRSVATTAAAALTGAVLGIPLLRGRGPDLSFAAAEWLRDARGLGMLLIQQPDGHIWRVCPIGDGEGRADARDDHMRRLHARPRLERAVYKLVRGGFIPEAQS